MIIFWGRKNLKRGILLSLAAFLLAALFASAAIGAGKTPELRFYAMDVGQSDSSLFIFPTGESMLIDAGTQASAKQLVRYLKQCGLKKIDVLVATHPHSDHIGGMNAVINAFAIGEIWDSGYAHGSALQISFYTAILNNKIPYGKVRQGHSKVFGKAFIEVLGPVVEIKGTPSDANNNSLVLRVTYGDVSFLMTGDMERAERQTIAPFPRSSVLKVAHHGSKNGMDAKMLREVDPYIIIFSYGKNNSYRHPHREVLKLLQANPRIKRFDTVNGTVKLRTDGKKLTFFKDREVITIE